MSQNLVEKLAQRYAVDLAAGVKVQAGDYLSIQPAHILTHDNTGAVMSKFRSIGASKIANPRQPMFALDHNVQDKSEANLKKYAGIEAFAKAMGVDFYPAGRGIGHQIMLEEGYAFPGTLAVASDSHSNMYGGLGCLGTPIVRTDAAAIWATGRTWWQVPPVAKVNLTGKLPAGVTGKDLIITLCGVFNHDEVLNFALEFGGDGIAGLTIDERLAIANMTTEWGALVGLFPIDTVTIKWLYDRAAAIEKRGLEGVPSDADGNGVHPRMNKARIAALEANPPAADPDAYYSKELTIDLSTVSPSVSGPHNVKTMTSVAEMEKRNLKIHKAYLVSCVNSRVDDLAEAAAVVKGKKVAAGVEFYVAAASREVQEESERRGDWQTLIATGAITIPPGCGPCIGLGVGLLQDGEVGISATNRNFKGRMGSKEAQAFLASPAVVAASALAGKIAGPAPFAGQLVKSNIKVAPASKRAAVSTSLLDGFPAKLSGTAIFCHQDNLNTDGIYPGKYTYIDDFTPVQMAAVVMENYDAEFGQLAQKGDILVGGYNFGTGSSREQAATALKYRGIQLVLAGSFSQTYKRNAINNGYLVLEAPELLEDLKAKFGKTKLTVRTDLEIVIDFSAAQLTCDGKTYNIGTVGTAAQELILTEGLENWVKKKIQ
ncbi:MAG: homoaconitase [Candidatus Neomarinimicrobiota bacterium]